MNRSGRPTLRMNRPLLAEGTGVQRILTDRANELYPSDVDSDAALEAVQGALNKVQLSRYAPLKVSLAALGQRYLDGTWGVRIMASAVVADRDTGIPLDVVVWRELAVAELTGTAVVSCAIELMQQMYLHEYLESVTVGGERVLDPHRNGG